MLVLLGSGVGLVWTNGVTKAPPGFEEAAPRLPCEVGEAPSDHLAHAVGPRPRWLDSGGFLGTPVATSTDADYRLGIATLGRRGWISIFILTLLTLVHGRAEAAYVPPPIAGHVTDAAGKLTPGEVSALDRKLSDYRRCSGNHIAVFYPKTLEGYSVEDVAYVTFNTWKIGEAKKDNGVLLVLATSERKIRIETGKGVGGDLTDVESSRILREVVGPNMKADRFFAAADQATTKIGAALGGCTLVDVNPTAETTAPAPPADPAPPPKKIEYQQAGRSWAMTGIVFLLFALAALIRRANRVGGLFTAFVLGFVFLIAVSAVPSSAEGYSQKQAFAIFGFTFLLGVIAIVRGWRNRNKPGSYSTSSSWSSSDSSDSSWSSSSSSDSSWSSSSSDSSSGSDYSGGGGSSGGGGASDSY